MWIMHQLKMKIKFKIVPKERTFNLLFHDDIHCGESLLLMSQWGKKKNKHIWKYIIGGEIFKICLRFNNCFMHCLAIVYHAL